MANWEHLRKLRQGVDAWNAWRESYPDVEPDLQGNRFDRDNLTGANFSEANLYRASFWRANLQDTDFSGARVSSGNFNGANLSNAKFPGANLKYARLVGANVEGADFSKCFVYGASIWNLQGEPKEQSNLIITPPSESIVVVDNLEIAQFVYLLLNNSKIRDVISTIGQKAVLILGRFIHDRKEILDAIADYLRKKGYLPMIFDFEKSHERDFTETIRILAGLSLFVIADITNPRSCPLELQATVPDYKIPFATILQEGEPPFIIFQDLIMYDWVLQPTIIYSTKETLLLGLENAVIKPALAKRKELLHRKAEEIKTKSIEDYLSINE